MSTMNSVNIIGRLTHDPELRYTKAGKAVSTLNMAINEKYKSGDEWKTDVCFIEVTAWEGTAEAKVRHWVGNGERQRLAPNTLKKGI